ncbi:hypothetical protein [Arthrobacter sp. Soil761]|uniref:hypothetical protein n=1 Tax=Arthrobacter sp. Soil761 TaxID=1736400 RepID=UPI0006FE9043|nr:hypothetical protein [Arthrobacter sp. Soil761]KRE76629.1 hypothetical protein ASG79_17515 [Arthrobacter sp. Soil761]
MRQDIQGTDQFSAGSITYEPDSFFAGKIVIDLAVDTPNPRFHLQAAAHRLQSDESLEFVGYLVDQVAERHLREATGSTAFIRQDGQHLNAHVFLPTPLAERPPVYGDEPAYLGTEEPRVLTDFQAAILPDVTESVRNMVPPALHPHVEDIAHLVAQEIPTRADLLRAYQRTSIPEVLEEIDQFGQPELLSPEHQKAMKTAQLSFPHPAAEAVRSTTPAVAAESHRAPAGASVGHAFDR